ncbi:MAG: leucine-rich repeat domain-containing protein [Paludibacteraceae bacterium]|nr:leucine-rich repeat domain-containing protein [Paludibacteraceae bacterium]
MRKPFLLSLLVLLLTTLSTHAYDFQSGDLYYNITSDNTVEVTYQQYSSFNYQGLTTATIPATVTYNGTTYSVTSIGGEAFFECSSLTSITIPNSVTSIGSAFLYCSSLTSITIPNSVTSIGGIAFFGCTSLTKTNYTGDIASWCNIQFNSPYANPISFSQNLYLNDVLVTDLVIPQGVIGVGAYAFNGCSSLTSVTIPNSVTSIGDMAFRYCSSLTSITIPNSVTSIGDYAFWGCSALADIYCYATTPPMCKTDTFSGVSKNCYIHVPAGTIRAYQLATGWSDFFYYYEIEEEETALSETEQANKPSRKIIRDGQVLILRNGETYDMMGQTL